MKRVFAVFLVLCMMLILSACRAGFSVQRAVDLFDGVVEHFGKYGLTRDYKLIGDRNRADDRYTGTYTANCKRDSGTDIIFGGVSVRERKITLTAFVKTESGKAQVKVRLGENTETLTADEKGFLQKELVFDGGGNYITVDYDRFTGVVMLSAEYTE